MQQIFVLCIAYTLPLAVFEGKALLRHLSHRRRRHRGWEDLISELLGRTSHRMKRNDLSKFSLFSLLYFSCLIQHLPVCCTVTMILGVFWGETQVIQILSLKLISP